ncbi:hypothetical protein C3747_117g55 [Trypanosoma cruzi]|uniref:EF-hand domain-containing protein n=2 Tax=Trypanosoma cruzi TaxID=5693 RepID=Q4DEB1_TRYCC|nr:hypothetical protein, conserved [Trypanosoma cruzi]EAN90857.1 hypothetical protein, conserved [Trypanosoma cruzi]PWV06286.1 hypothetical protein C3747_117g55 [Trypanosoma cruzi]RNC47132.1 hypothetical protein TcCL_NonESM03025 [Trypanosoma cruzi]|eukprot:XP_812708.1 hypothetical protein [Trypanosoma cruzi strain CL Brener]
MFVQQPPPPRYVLQVSTGNWQKKSILKSAAPMKEAKQLQNSVEYFLKRAMCASVPTSKNEDGSLCESTKIMKELDLFETRHFGSKSRYSLFLPTSLQVNPIIGLLCGLPLYQICDALIQRKDAEWQARKEENCSVGALRLSFEELYDVCTQLVPNMVSEDYLHRMFIVLLPSEEEDSLLLSSFFSFLVENAFHPALDRNVNALFSAFDPDGTGVISAATLTSKVLLAWAELHLFGNLRGEWEKMAAALELTNGVDLRIVDGARLLTPAATRAVFCALNTLYVAMESIDMDGRHLNSPSS